MTSESGGRTKEIQVEKAKMILTYCLFNEDFMISFIQFSSTIFELMVLTVL